MSPERIRPGSARSRRGTPPEASRQGELTPEEESVPAALPGAPGATTEREPSPAPGPVEAPVGEEPSSGGPEPSPGEAELEQAAAAAALEQPAVAEDAGVEAAPLAPGGMARSAPVKRPGWFRRIYLGQSHFDFVRHRRWWYAVSLAVVLAGAISLGARGLNLGIEFVGGTSWTFPAKSLGTNSTAAVNKTRAALTPYGLGGATITVLGVGQKATIQVEAKLVRGQSAASAQGIEKKVAQDLGRLSHLGVNGVSIESVGPSWGGEITTKAIEALVVFFLFIALYISIFFEWRMALAAIIAVCHDVAVTVGIYSLTGLEVSPDTVVAFLTILGYSLYDTIVVFDRLRDNMKLLGPSNKLTFSDLVNLSMNQTLARSINTSLVAILPILSVLILGAEVLGASTLEYFGYALLIGLTSGAYSSIFIASPLVAQMKEREPRWQAVRERLAKRGGDRLLLSPSDIAAGLLGSDGALQRGGRSERRARAGAGRIRPGGAVVPVAPPEPPAGVTAGPAVPPAERSSGSGRATARSSAGGGRRSSRPRRKGGRP